MSPENQWLVQMYFLLKGCLYLGDMLVFGGVTVENEGIIPLMEYHGIPIPSMYGIFTYIWLICMGFHVGKYTKIHGCYGIGNIIQVPSDMVKI